jgi:hypothetical protein
MMIGDRSHRRTGCSARSQRPARSLARLRTYHAMVEQMRRSGQLQEFNSRYKRGRAAALAEGRGFMGYAPA